MFITMALLTGRAASVHSGGPDCNSSQLQGRNSTSGPSPKPIVFPYLFYNSTPCHVLFLISCTCRRVFGIDYFFFALFRIADLLCSLFFDGYACISF